MKPLITIAATELQADPSARLWSLAIHLAEHVELQAHCGFRPFWLAFQYDAQVMNGGHLQYFHNCGTASVAETVSALHEIGAHGQAALLTECWNQVKHDPVAPVSSLEEYSSLAAARSFTSEDAAYYDQQPAVLDLLESHYAGLLVQSVAVGA